MIGYLSHPFHNRHAIREWELEVEKTYKCLLLNPFYDNDRDDEMGKIDRGEIDKYEIDPESIVSRDLEAVYSCDYLLAIIDGTVSYGTIMEIAYAFAAEIPVYIVCTNGHEKHPWLRYHAVEVFSSYYECEEKLLGLAGQLKVS